MSSRSSEHTAGAAYQLMREGKLDAALPLAQKAVAAASHCVSEHGMLAQILYGLGRRAEAEKVVGKALSLGACSADAYDALAHVSISLGQPERANALYQRAVECEPRSSRFWYNLASSHRSLGQLADAEAACNRAIELDRFAAPSYLLRSELRVQTVDSNHVVELESCLARLGPHDRAHIALGYALAKELDDLRRYDDAFRWFAHAANARRRYLAYDVKVDEEKMRRIVEVYSVETLKGGRTDDARSEQYLFIVGLPRSGTTLLERILTGLRDVRTNGETDNFARALLSATPEGPEDVFARTARSNPEVVAQKYISLAGQAADGGRVVEKLPINYLYLGAIHRALPHAKILWMRRSALDSCFAMYRTLFGDAYPFTYNFQDLARYYAAYERLMNYWQSVLGMNLYQVNYGDLVAHPEAVGTAIARYCGLQWDASSIQIEDNRSASFTASASQIRRPIYTTSVDRWRHYREHLKPLAAHLKACGTSVEDPS